MIIRILIPVIAAIAFTGGMCTTFTQSNQVGPPYGNCSQAHADGRYNIPRDDPAYQPKLDRDNDGIACES